MLSILRREAHVRCRRYDGISPECAGAPAKQGGTADDCVNKYAAPVLDNVIFTFVMDWVFFCMQMYQNNSVTATCERKGVSIWKTGREDMETMAASIYPKY